MEPPGNVRVNCQYRQIVKFTRSVAPHEAIFNRTSENPRLGVTPFAEMLIYLGIYGQSHVFALLSIQSCLPLEFVHFDTGEDAYVFFPTGAYARRRHLFHLHRAHSPITVFFSGRPAIQHSSSSGKSIRNAGRQNGRRRAL